MTFPRSLSALLLLSLTLVLPACGPSHTGRIMSDDEADLVGSRRAGGATYRTIIDGALKELSEEYRSTHRGQPAFSKIKVAFVGVDNATNEPLGSWRDQINEFINLGIYDSGDFQDISYERFVKPAIEEVGVSRDKLILPRNLRALSEVLEKSGNTVDALLFAKLTQGDTLASNIKQADYLLTLELVRVSGDNTGTRVMARKGLRKEYTR